MKEIKGEFYCTCGRKLDVVEYETQDTSRKYYHKKIYKCPDYMWCAKQYFREEDKVVIPKNETLFDVKEDSLLY